MTDKRIQCPHCKVKTWSKDFAQFMTDHDRSDGNTCRKAQADYMWCEQCNKYLSAFDCPHWDYES